MKKFKNYQNEITQAPNINKNAYNNPLLVVWRVPPMNKTDSHIKNVIAKSMNVDRVQAIFSDDRSNPIILMS